jgi:hypothetical protein
VLFLREPTMTPTAITTAPIIGDTRRRDYVSFTQLDQYLRCPLRYSFVYVHHVEPDFVPASRALGYGERETRESLRDLAMRMLAIFHREFDPRTQVLAVEDPFRVPLVDLETGEVLDRDLVGTVDLLEGDAERRAGRCRSQDISQEVHGPSRGPFTPAVRVQLRDVARPPRG